ncbi:hypothetical protein GOBAR_AA08081 [Gossypium barbadense]|uniref:Uncharacterized protein n=1 Tax=Gossypium barbadense TaxID=3634 RepID=A0A2P5YAH4_GOSBA|nr:hypothetical protein GOBAR_AA08081 [Gossypium barbadense]
MFQDELVHAQEYVVDRVGVSDGLIERAYDLAIRGIKSLFDKLDNLVIDEIDEAKKSISIDDSIIIEDDIILRDPVHAVTKGHPTSLRKTSSIEESNKKSKTCSFCNCKCHTKHTCGRRQQPRSEYNSIPTSCNVDISEA